MKKLKRINYDYFKTFEEIYLLIKLKLFNQKGLPQKKVRNVLIINTSLVGEFMMALHALRYFIKKTNAQTDMIVSPPLKRLAERIIGVNNVFTANTIYKREIEKSKSKKINNLKNYDLVLVMRLSKESYSILKKIKFKHLISYFNPFFRLMQQRMKSTVGIGTEKQWREVNFEIIGEKEQSFHFYDIFNFKKSDFQKIKKLPGMREEGKHIIIHTGSDWPIKFWENEKWIELLKRINRLGKYNFIFVGGTKEEGDSFKKIQSKLDFNIYSLIKKIDLIDLLLVLKESDCFIGVDSGPRNMAHLVDLPSISLLGPGAKNFMPINKRDIVIDKSDCIMCTNLFCYKMKTCLQKIDVDEVFKGFKNILKYNS